MNWPEPVAPGAIEPSEIVVGALVVVNDPTFVPTPEVTAVRSPAGNVIEPPTSESVKELEVFWIASVTWKNCFSVLIVPSMIKMPGIAGKPGCGGGITTMCVHKSEVQVGTEAVPTGGPGDQPPPPPLPPPPPPPPPPQLTSHCGTTCVTVTGSDPIVNTTVKIEKLKFCGSLRLITPFCTRVAICDALSCVEVALAITICDGLTCVTSRGREDSDGRGGAARLSIAVATSVFSMFGCNGTVRQNVVAEAPSTVLTALEPPLIVTVVLAREVPQIFAVVAVK